MYHDHEKVVFIHAVGMHLTILRVKTHWRMPEWAGVKDNLYGEDFWLPVSGKTIWVREEIAGCERCSQMMADLEIQIFMIFPPYARGSVWFGSPGVSAEKFLPVMPA